MLKKFANNLRAIAVSAKHTKAVTILALVGIGSKYEEKRINGISHFLEHMLFKGTKKRPNKIAVAETLDKIGGVYNAFTSEEYTGFFAKVADVHFKTGLDWVSDIFLNSTLPNSEIDREKRIIIEEINMRQDHPSAYVQILFSNLLYGDQPAGWDIAGTRESVLGITKKDLVDYKKNYLASNTIISIAGNIDIKEAHQKANQYFAKIPVGSAVAKKPVIEKQLKPAMLIKERKTDQTHLCLGVRAYNLFHPHHYTLNIIETILGKMMSSRLFMEIREKMGLAYYIRTDIEANPDTGFLVSQAGVDNSKAEKAIVAILKEYKKLSQKRVSLPELKKAKENIKGKIAISLEPSDALSSFYACQELLEGKITTPDEIFRRIDKVSSDDILKVSKDIFRPENLNLSLVGPIKNQGKILKILNI